MVNSDGLEITRSAFRVSRWRQALSVWLIVALVLATTQTNVHAQVYDPVFYYYHGDHLGSSNILVDRTGVLVQQYEYTAFGLERVRSSSAAFAVTHRYTSQHLDEATGLYYYQSRYYDPEVGRFIQADTEVPWPDDPQTLNRYSYVNNNPYKYVDPSGHELLTAVIVGVVVGAAIGGATAAATGGNIWMGVLTGAIGGLFGGLGAWAGGVIGGTTGGLVGAAAGGAAGGAVSAAVTGGDVGMGALVGAISGVIAFGASELTGVVVQGEIDTMFDDIAGHAISSGAGAVAGGIGAELQGGDFWQGAAYGAIGGAIAYSIAVDLPDAIQNAQNESPRPHLWWGLVGKGLTAAGRAAWRGVTKAWNALRANQLTRAELAKSLSKQQVELLRKLFGGGREGAQRALEHIRNGGQLPQGLTRQSLETYLRIARKAVAEGIDTTGTQAVRIKVAEEALKRMK